MEKQSDRGPIVAQGEVVDEPVPCTIHQVWLGGVPMSPILGAFVDAVRFQVYQQGWGHILWDEVRLAHEFGGEWPQLRSQCCHLSQASNVARYLALREYGGLYLDTDVELFTLPDAWWSGAWIAGTSPEPSPRQVNPCCLAAPPGHPYLVRMLDAIERGEVDLSKHMAAGPLLAIDKIGPDVNIWPGHVWHGRRGRAGALGHHYGWGPRLNSFIRRHQMPPVGEG